MRKCHPLPVFPKIGRIHLWIMLCSLLFILAHVSVLALETSRTGYRRLQINNAANEMDDSSTGNIFADFFANIWLLLLNLFTGGQSRCETVSCGLFGLFYVSHTGIPGTSSCIETCTIFPPPSDQCGVCGTVAPTHSPAPSFASTTASPVVPQDQAFSMTLDMSLVPNLDHIYFTQAAEKWQRVITGDLPAVVPRSRPTYSGCSYPAQIDDIYVCARYAKNDGKGGTLAYAAPDRSRGGAGGLPFSGFISFDEEDVATLQLRGNFQNIVEHEFGHILGLGSRWAALGVTGPGEDCPYFGVHANSEYQALTGCDAIPTERDGGAGTQCVHFDDGCLNNELMTGYINRDEGNPLSRLTIAALEDLGYEVDYAKADSFSGNNIPSWCHCRQLRSLVTTLQQETTGSSHKRPRRRLSVEMKNYAIQQGQAFLREQAQRTVDLNSRQDESDLARDTTSFIGDQFVSVWVQEKDDGDIFSVTVWADSTNQ